MYITVYEFVRHHIKSFFPADSLRYGTTLPSIRVLWPIVADCSVVGCNVLLLWWQTPSATSSAVVRPRWPHRW
jgi:hypothetical protein